jgi:xanthine dehydrogenase accessory factor
MRDILRQLPQLIRSGQRAALCTVVRTVGSTPQKPGARLLILPDFRNVGTLGGGCVEAEARKQAAALMRSGERRLLKFQLDNDYGWDDGLICGGSMSIFVDLTDRDEDATLYAELTRLVEDDVPVVLATVVDAPTQSLLGRKLLFSGNGSRVGTLGSPELDDAVPNVGVRALEENEPQTWRSDNDTTVYIEAILPQVKLVVAGAGHVGAAVCRFAAICDFHVTMIDDRSEYANAANLPDAHRIVVADIAKTLEETPMTPLTFVVIVTRGHRNDEECLHAVINTNAGYKGLIGSRRKIKLIFDDLRERGIAAERLAEVHAPIGLDIGSKTVPEIAISIVAELIQVRNSSKLSHLVETFRFAATELTVQNA